MYNCCFGELFDKTFFFFFLQLFNNFSCTSQSIGEKASEGMTVYICLQELTDVP